MQKFKELIKSLENSNRIHKVKHLLDDVRPFVFCGRDDSELSMEIGKTKIDLPFKTVSFEMAENNPYKLLVGDKKKPDIKCFLIHEIKPKHYFLAVSFDYNGFEEVTFIDSEKDKKFFDIIAPIINVHLKLLQKKDVGTCESQPIRLKNPNNPKKKITHKPINTYIVASKKTYQNSFNTIKVDWNHAWEVRGHWRKIEGLGLDRDGNRTEPNNTWIKPYKKGKGELIKKTRIVK